MREYLSYGGGVGSTGLLCYLLPRIRNGEIEVVFCDHGGDYPETYQDSRKYFKDEKIPLIFHAIEKVKRYEVCGGVDSLWDLAGYAVLEIVCKKEADDDKR